MLKKTKKTRVQFDFTQKALNRLDNLVSNTEAATRAEVVRNSLRVYSYLTQMMSDGYRFTLIKGDHQVDIVPMPFNGKED